jgi:hypothetical protein
MKKIILTLAIAISSIAAFAGNETVSSNVVNAFNKEFTGAKDVQWTSGKDCFKASFVYNSQHVIAFYNLDGELMGMSRNISSLDLPIMLQTSLKKDYTGYWISDLFEVSNADGTTYYITMEKADGQVILKSGLGSKWSIYKKATKA